MLIHLFVSVPRNDYLDEDMPDDVGIPDFPEEDIAACPIPFQPSRFPSSTGPPNHHAFHHPLAVQDPGQRTRVMPRLGTPCPGGTWSMAKTMCQAGVSAELCRNIYQNT